VVLGIIFYYGKHCRRISFAELYYSSCIYPREAEKHDRSHGTLRNKVSALLKKGKIDLAYYSTAAFESTKHFPLVRIKNV
jgi:hypothetical protein